MADSAPATGGTATADRPTVTIPFPLRNTEVHGTKQEVIISYVAGKYPVSRMDLIIDGYVRYTENPNPPALQNSKTYHLDTTQFSDAPHTIAARVVDTAGNTAQASVDVYISNTDTDTTPPAVSIQNPKPDRTVSGKVSVDILARDNVAVKWVILFVDGTLKLMRNNAPFNWVWDTLATDKKKDGTVGPMYPNGLHQLMAKALDPSNNETQSAIVPVNVYNAENDPAAGSTKAQSPITTPPGVITPVEPEESDNHPKAGVSSSDPNTPPPSGRSPQDLAPDKGAGNPVVPARPEIAKLPMNPATVTQERPREVEMEPARSPRGDAPRSRSYEPSRPKLNVPDRGGRQPAGIAVPDSGKVPRPGSAQTHVPKNKDVRVVKIPGSLPPKKIVRESGGLGAGAILSKTKPQIESRRTDTIRGNRRDKTISSVETSSLSTPDVTPRQTAMARAAAAILTAVKWVSSALPIPAAEPERQKKSPSVEWRNPTLIVPERGRRVGKHSSRISTSRSEGGTPDGVIDSGPEPKRKSLNVKSPTLTPPEGSKLAVVPRSNPAVTRATPWELESVGVAEPPMPGKAAKGSSHTPNLPEMSMPEIQPKTVRRNGPSVVARAVPKVGSRLNQGGPVQDPLRTAPNQNAVTAGSPRIGPGAARMSRPEISARTAAALSFSTIGATRDIRKPYDPTRASAKDAYKGVGETGGMARITPPEVRRKTHRELPVTTATRGPEGKEITQAGQNHTRHTALTKVPGVSGARYFAPASAGTRPSTTAGGPTSTSNRNPFQLVKADTGITAHQSPGIASPISTPPIVVLQMPRETRPGKDRPVRLEARRKYMVRLGDTVSSIAKDYGISTQMLLKANGLRESSRVLPGRELVLPRGPLVVFFDAEPLKFDAEPSIFSGGVALGPFRTIFEHGGGSVEWLSKGKRVHAKNSDHEVQLRIGSDVAIVNDSEMKLDLATFLRAGRTIVPLRFFRAALGAEVDWNPETGSIAISSK
ncbi:MAG: LysM peptidoglycan-binding domain-containing protein [Armatimonadetes bacterium]|nr:LysM peptidoglycan-binding domain-containing protein [Armatimonadota bacterium]